MRGATHGTGAVVTVSRAPYRRKRYANERCSVCHERLRSDAVPITEPEGVPEPRRTWVLCRDCYQALVIEMRRSPVRTPVRLRVAMGIVASERWPDSSASTSRSVLRDRQKILLIAWVFVIAMLVHLALIVAIAYIAR